jgi:glutathione synthase/RimK-type ligase-like ATP-grasp enzyme
VTLIFATCDHDPSIARDDEPLAAALRARNVEVTPVPWTEIDPYAVIDAPPILLRSTWDYHRVPTMFLSWLQSLEESGRAVWNDAHVARGNVDKVYLRRLDAFGVAMPATAWLDHVDNAAIAHALAAHHWDRAVLKPRIGATAYGIHLVSHGTELSAPDLAPSRASGALLQAFVPEIEARGELSFVYVEGTFSHAVAKHAKPGEFRVQQDFGGSVEAFTPPLHLVAFTDRVLSQVTSPTLYARIDIVDTARGPMLMELELIEPELYFTIVPTAADTLASAIVRRLT